VTDRLLDAGQVAERLNVPVSWVREQTRSGSLPHLQLGRYRRYEWEAVVGWLEEQRAGQWRKHRPALHNGRAGA
jgi:excisionase family DNA binding protein